MPPDVERHLSRVHLPALIPGCPDRSRAAYCQRETFQLPDAWIEQSTQNSKHGHALTSYSAGEELCCPLDKRSGGITPRVIFRPQFRRHLNTANDETPGWLKGTHQQSVQRPFRKPLAGSRTACATGGQIDTCQKSSSAIFASSAPPHRPVSAKHQVRPEESKAAVPPLPTGFRWSPSHPFQTYPIDRGAFHSSTTAGSTPLYHPNGYTSYFPLSPFAAPTTNPQKPSSLESPRLAAVALPPPVSGLSLNVTINSNETASNTTPRSNLATIPLNFGKSAAEWMESLQLNTQTSTSSAANQNATKVSPPKYSPVAPQIPRLVFKKNRQARTTPTVNLPRPATSRNFFIPPIYDFWRDKSLAPPPLPPNKAVIHEQTKNDLGNINEQRRPYAISRSPLAPCEKCCLREMRISRSPKAERQNARCGRRPSQSPPSSSPQLQLETNAEEVQHSNNEMNEMYELHSASSENSKPEGNFFIDGSCHSVALPSLVLSASSKYFGDDDAAAASSRLKLRKFDDTTLHSRSDTVSDRKALISDSVASSLRAVRRVLKRGHAERHCMRSSTAVSCLEGKGRELKGDTDDKATSCLNPICSQGSREDVLPSLQTNAKASGKDSQRERNAGRRPRESQPCPAGVARNWVDLPLSSSGQRCYAIGSLRQQHAAQQYSMPHFVPNNFHSSGFDQVLREASIGRSMSPGDMRSVIPPLDYHLLPTFGDSSTITQGANSRSKLAPPAIRRLAHPQLVSVITSDPSRRHTVMLAPTAVEKAKSLLTTEQCSAWSESITAQGSANTLAECSPQAASPHRSPLPPSAFYSRQMKRQSSAETAISLASGDTTPSIAISKPKTSSAFDRGVSRTRARTSENSDVPGVTAADPSTFGAADEATASHKSLLKRLECLESQLLMWRGYSESVNGMVANFSAGAVEVLDKQLEASRSENSALRLKLVESLQASSALSQANSRLTDELTESQTANEECKSKLVAAERYSEEMINRLSEISVRTAQPVKQLP